MDINGIFRKLAFALRFAEPNLVVSGEIGDDSRILYKRDIVDRAKTLAPFLKFDRDPYPALINGNVMWMLDAYTTSNMFPYAQNINPRAVKSGDLSGSYNYVRNSVKVVIDAYNGSVDFYVIDKADPLAQSYQKQFPDLFTESEPSQELREHFRYPEDLFRIQTDMWGRYRINEAAEFYDAAGAWAIAQDPGNSIGLTAIEAVFDATGNIVSRSEARISPQYLLLRLPGEEDESFVIFRPFVPFSDDDSRKNLEGFMVVHNDPERYGEIEVFEIRSSTPVDGPALFNSNIQTEEEISQRVTLLNQNGSTVVPGNLLLIPVEDSLLYVRPLFIEATGTTAVPELQFVIVGVGPDVVIANSFEEALELIIPDLDIDLQGGVATSVKPGGEANIEENSSASSLPKDDKPSSSSNQLDVNELLAAANNSFAEASSALRSGDLAGYQDAVEQAAEFIQRASQLLSDNKKSEASSGNDGSA